MHWRHVSITTTPCWGSRLVALRAHVLLAERIGAHPPQSVCAPGPARRCGMQGFALWLHAWRWCTWRASFDPQHHGGALLWRHMHMVYYRLCLWNLLPVFLYIFGVILILLFNFSVIIIIYFFLLYISLLFISPLFFFVSTLSLFLPYLLAYITAKI